MIRRLGAIAVGVVLACDLVAARGRDHRVTVAKGVQLFTHEEGRGRPLVVLHGGPGLDSNYLAPDLGPFAAKHRVIYYDQRGSGGSTLSKGVTAETLVADLEALRRSLKLERLTILGHSWGAGLAALYAMAHPDRVARLVLVDAIPPWRQGLAGYSDRLRSRLTPEENALVRKAIAQRDRASTPAQYRSACRAYWSVFVNAYFADRALVSRSRGTLCSAPGAALGNGLKTNESVMSSLGEYDWRPQLENLRAPTLIVHGAQDPIPLDTAREWRTSMPDARLVVLAKSGHMSYVEEPEAFFPAVEEFLNGRWPAQAE